MKPIKSYFDKEKKINNFKEKFSIKNKKPINEEMEKSTEEKLQFNSEFEKHASIAKLKEKHLEEKIGKWLEEVDTDVVKVKNSCKETKDDRKEYVKEENDETILNENKKSFAEMFGEKCNDSFKKTSSTLDDLDQLLLKEEVEEKLQSNEETMEVDILITKESAEKTFIGKPKSPKLNKSFENKKKDTQTKIHDYFKKNS